MEEIRTFFEAAERWGLWAAMLVGLLAFACFCVYRAGGWLGSHFLLPIKDGLLTHLNRLTAAVEGLAAEAKARQEEQKVQGQDIRDIKQTLAGQWPNHPFGYGSQGGGT